MEFYVAEGKKELIPFAMAWMEMESIMLSEISQAVTNRDKYHMISPLTGAIFLKIFFFILTHFFPITLRERRGGERERERERERHWCEKH